MYNFNSPNQQHRVQTLWNQKMTSPPRPAPTTPFNPLLPQQAPPEPQYRPTRRMGLTPATDPADGYGMVKPHLSPGVFALSSQSQLRIGDEAELPLRCSKRPLAPPTPSEKISMKKRYPPVSLITDTSERPPRPQTHWQPSPMTLKQDLRNSEYRGELGLPTRKQGELRNSSSVFALRPASREETPTQQRQTAAIGATAHQYIANRHYAGLYRSRTQGSQVILAGPAQTTNRLLA